jgi:DHA1 family multidrug/chloramphenicol efflux transport protein-like MFS transporter
LKTNNTIKIALFPFLLVFFEMATYLSSDMYLPALPTVMRHFSLTHEQTQLTLTSWFFGAISIQLLLGPIADRYGRKKVLCFGGILFSFATFICAATSNFHFFLLGRLIQGMGICFMAVPGYATIHELFEQNKAIKILALMASISVLAPAIGPLLGSAILTIADWRWIFGFLVIWASLSIILLIIFMPETVSTIQSLKFSSIVTSYKNIFCNSRFMLTISVFGLLFCGFITWIAAGPFLVIDQFHLSPLLFGIFQALIFLSNIIANRFVKYYVDRVGPKKLIHIGLHICFGISLISFVASIAFPHFMPMIIVTYAVYAFGSGLAFSPLNRLTIETSNEPMGSRMAVFSTLMSGFATLGSVLVSLFYHNTLQSLSGIMFIVMLIAYTLYQIQRRI